MRDEREDSTRQVGRRRLLRRAGTVAAGVAGAGVVGAVAAAPASANAGDPLVLGSTANDSGTAATSVTVNNTTGATLAVANTGTGTDSHGFTTFGPQLRLTPAATGDYMDPTNTGSLGMGNDGTVWIAQTPGFADFLYSTAFAEVTYPITPTRAFYTKFSNQRARIINPSGNLDSQFRLIGGHKIHIDLTDFVNFGYTVYATLSIIAPTGSGFASIAPYDPAAPAIPLTSSMNFATNQNMAVTVVSGLGFFDTTHTDVVSIYSGATAHVALDVVALSAASPGQINPTLLGAASTARARAARFQQAQSTTPRWHK